MKDARVMVIPLMLLALILRVLNLNGRPIWYDEAFAILYAARPLATMWYGTVTLVGGAASDVHPLFYYGLLHEWMRFVGESAFAVRFLSVSFGLVTIAVVYRLARILLGDTVALFAAMMLALAPFHIAYSQEARMYAQLGCFSMLAVLAWVRYEGTRARRWWLLFVGSGAAAIYSHNLGFLMLSALGAWVVVSAAIKRDFVRLRAIVVAGLAITFIWLPWLLLLPSQLGKIEQAYWVTRPDAISLVQTIVTFIVDFDNARLPIALLPFALFAALLLIVVGLLEFRRQGTVAVGFLAALGVAPALLLFVISLWHPLYLTRALMPSFLVLVILTAWIVRHTPRRVRQFIGSGLLALAAASLFSYYRYEEFPRAPFRDALAMLSAQMQPSDAVLHDNKLTYFPMHYYEPLLSEAFVADPAGAGSDTLALPTQQALQIFSSRLNEVVDGHSTVWFIIFEEAVEQGSGNLTWLNQNYRLARKERFNDLNIYLYQK